MKKDLDVKEMVDRVKALVGDGMSVTAARFIVCNDSDLNTYGFFREYLEFCQILDDDPELRAIVELTQ